LIYEQHPNWRKADYVVEIAGDNRLPVPEGWTQVYSVALGPEDDRELILHGTTAAGGDSPRR
jgi:hypothetical protein